jgi:hypothetical protein
MAIGAAQAHLQTHFTLSKAIKSSTIIEHCAVLLPIGCKSSSEPAPARLRSTIGKRLEVLEP